MKTRTPITLLFLLITAAFAISSFGQAPEDKYDEILEKLNALEKTTASTEQIAAIYKKIEDVENPELAKRLRTDREGIYLSQQVFGMEFICIDRLHSMSNRIARMTQGNARPEPVINHRDLLEQSAYRLRIAPKSRETTMDFSAADGTLTISGKVNNTGADAKLSHTLTPSENYKNTPETYLVESLHKELKNPDYLYDTYRFGGALNYVDEAGSLSAQLGLRVYPAYHRHIEGRFSDIQNNWRRLSGFVGIGPEITDGAGSRDIDGLVYSLGVGYDLTHEVTLFVGHSFYEYNESVENEAGEAVTNSGSDNSFTFGISLNSELFQKLIK